MGKGKEGKKVIGSGRGVEVIEVIEEEVVKWGEVRGMWEKKLGEMEGKS